MAFRFLNSKSSQVGSIEQHSNEQQKFGHPTKKSGSHQPTISVLKNLNRNWAASFCSSIFQKLNLKSSPRLPIFWVTLTLLATQFCRLIFSKKICSGAMAKSFWFRQKSMLGGLLFVLRKQVFRLKNWFWLTTRTALLASGLLGGFFITAFLFCIVFMNGWRGNATVFLEK